MYSEKTPDDGQRNCPKHVEFYSKDKFENLVHLVCFIIRISHDARSPERQLACLVLKYYVELNNNCAHLLAETVEISLWKQYILKV